LPTAELEGVPTGLIIAMLPEPFGGAAVGNDVEEAQELPVEAPAGGENAGQEGVFDSSISSPVAVHLGGESGLLGRLERFWIVGGLYSVTALRNFFLIVGGLYSVTALRKINDEGDSVY